MRLKELLIRIPRTKYGRQTFLLSLDGKRIKLLDVGCGNNSPMRVKRLCRDCYYVDVDVDDFNQNAESISLADEYHIFAPNIFAESIDSLPSDFDVVLSTHNLEHCNEPEQTLRAMCGRLKRGGRLYLSFPNSDSVNFPHREGTLNFYDGPTHIYLPDLVNVLDILKQEGMEISKAIKGYKPLYYRIIGGVLEPLSKRKGKIMKGTWAYWGFESVIIAYKTRE